MSRYPVHAPSPTAAIATTANGVRQDTHATTAPDSPTTIHRSHLIGSETPFGRSPSVSPNQIAEDSPRQLECFVHGNAGTCRGRRRRPPRAQMVFRPEEIE